MQTSFTLILSLELESRFGLETQVGTSHRKQRNVVSLHSAQCNRTALGSLKMQPSWTWLMKHSTAAWADTQSLLSNRRSLQQGWHLVQHLTLSHRALMEQCNKHRENVKISRFWKALFLSVEPQKLTQLTCHFFIHYAGTKGITFNDREPSMNWTLQNFLGAQMPFLRFLFPNPNCGDSLGNRFMDENAECNTLHFAARENLFIMDKPSHVAPEQLTGGGKNRPVKETLTWHLQ